MANTSSSKPNSVRDARADQAGAIGAVLKAAYPKLVAGLIRRFGDVDRAEDAASEAMVRGLARWSTSGLPQEPMAWLFVTARNYDVDQLRKQQRLTAYEHDVRTLVSDEPDAEDNGLLPTRLEDDLLRLIFSCCHEALTPATQVLLTLKVVLGFSVAEVARAMLLQPKTAERRITRAKAQLKLHAQGYASPSDTQLIARLASVRRVIYLVFNQGYSQQESQSSQAADLVDEAIRLARMVGRLFRFDPEVRSLLALMLLNSARLPARLDAAGFFVPLHQQDRSQWRQGRIQEGIALIDAVFLSRPPPSSLQLQAAISALHCQAKTAEDTDWPQIVALYERLTRYDASPVVQVNHASAIAFGGDLAGAKLLLDGSVGDKRLLDYQPFHVACGYVEQALGNPAAAAVAYRRALALTKEQAQHKFLQQQLRQLTLAAEG